MLSTSTAVCLKETERDRWSVQPQNRHYDSLQSAVSTDSDIQLHCPYGAPLQGAHWSRTCSPLQGMSLPLLQQKVQEVIATPAGNATSSSTTKGDPGLEAGPLVPHWRAHRLTATDLEVQLLVMRGMSLGTWVCCGGGSGGSQGAPESSRAVQQSHSTEQRPTRQSQGP